MNILYVTGMPGALQQVLRGKTNEADILRALPAFYYPWKMLIDRGHTVDFVMTSNFNEPYNIKVDWFSEDNIIKNIYAPYKNPGKLRIFRQIKRFSQLLYYTNKAVKQKHYDFIYCKAFEGVAGQIIANIHHIPHGVRSFGDYMWLEIKKYGAKKAAWKHPLEYLCYQLDCDFFLMTEDHTDIMLTYNSWHNPKNHYPFYMWKHGIVFKEIGDLHSDVPIPDEPYIFFPARIDPIKRHDRVIEVLNILHKNGNKIHLYFCGSEYSPTYRRQLNQQIKEEGLERYVHFLGVVSQDTLKVLAYHAVANVIMIDCGSRNNIFYEILSVGSVIACLDGGGVDEYIIDGESGFLIKDENDAAQRIKELLCDPNLRERISLRAREIAKEKVMSIEERYGKEVELIENCGKADGNNTEKVLDRNCIPN